MVNKILIPILILLSVFAKAQETNVDSLDIVESKHYKKSIGFKFDNDMFFQTDYYYTSGENIFFIHPGISKSPITKLFISKLNHNDEEYNGVFIDHQMYTPTDTPSDTVKAGDRPYAASLSISQFQVLENNFKGYRITSTFSLGVIGDLAFGEEIQSIIHGITPSEQPVGWSDQISNDILLNYNLKFDKRLFESNNFEWIASGSATLGTVNTDISVSTTVRLGWMDSYFSSYAPKRNSGFNTWLEFGLNAKLVIYNAYLQGGAFNRTSPYVKEASEINRLVGAFEARYYLQYNKHRLIFEAYKLSPEFNYSLWHNWGRVSYQYWF